MDNIPLSLASEFEKQSLEIDFFLHFQNERLRKILQEESRRHQVLLQIYESKCKILMNEKDDNLAIANNKTMELQNMLVMAEIEAKSWQNISIENEAMIVNLNNKISQMRVKDEGVAEDAESVCDREDQQGQLGEYKKKNSTKEKLACKLCHVRSSCLVFLPCRHLCCCKSCEGVLGFCPVCGNVKKGSLEAFFV